MRLPATCSGTPQTDLPVVARTPGLRSADLLLCKKGDHGVGKQTWAWVLTYIFAYSALRQTCPRCLVPKASCL